MAQDEVLTLCFDALLGLHEQAEARRVDEVELGDVDDQRIAALLGEVDQRGAQRRGGAELEVATNAHDGTPLVVFDRERDCRLGRSIVASHGTGE